MDTMVGGSGGRAPQAPSMALFLPFSNSGAGLDSSLFEVWPIYLLLGLHVQ